MINVDALVFAAPAPAHAAKESRAKRAPRPKKAQDGHASTPRETAREGGEGRGRGRSRGESGRGERGKGRGSSDRAKGARGKGKGSLHPKPRDAQTCEELLVDMGFDRLAGRAMLEHCSGDFDSTVELLKLSGSRPAAGARRADHLLKFTAPKREAVPIMRSKHFTQRRHQRSYGAFAFSAFRLLVADDALSCASPWLTDADDAVEWRAVCAVDIAASATAELLARRCPICLLDDCAAPVALKCGHAFCASCIVRHAMMNDVTRSKRCPCCQGSLDVLDLRPARWAETHAIAVGKPLELVLCERPKASRAAALVGSLNEGAEARLPRGPACSLQSKITLADDAASDSVFEAFFDGLRMAYAACEDSVERKDAESAKSALERVRSAYITRRAPDVSRSEAVPTGKKAPDALEERRYFFYAAADGQHVYLHPLLLNVFLAACGGDAAMLPKKLLLKKVQGLELFEQGAESRKKMPWLAHLQLGVDAHLADVSFDDIFSVEDSASFGWALKLRGALDCDAALKSAVDARTKRLDSQRRSERQSEKRDEARRRASEQKRPQAKKFELRQADFVALRLERDEKLLANLQNDSDDDGEASTDDELRNSPPVGPSFALLVSRGFAAELNCPALGPPPGGGAGPSTSPPPAPAWCARGGAVVARGGAVVARAAAAPAANGVAAWPAGAWPRRARADSLSNLADAALDEEGVPLPPAALSFGGALDAAMSSHRASAGADDASQEAKGKQKKVRAKPLSLTGGGRRY